MTTYPLATLAAQVGAAGISAPSYDDVYLSLVARYQAIYGSDVVLTADTQDGQWIGVIAQAVTDVNAGAVAVYNSFSPSTAQGVGLSSAVKINGLKREASSFSSVPVTITGTVGTTITNGTVKDAAGNSWALPASVIIPSGASITVTAICQTAGAITAEIGSITKIGTPTRGWLTVTNASAAAPGAAGESDATLRQRQALSTGIAAVTPMETIAAAVENVAGVTRVNYSENPNSATNSDGVPGHSFGLVVEGGDATAIAQTIANTKNPGTGTYGTISETVIDSRGIPNIINFDPPTYQRIVVALMIKAKTGYTVAIGNNIVAAIANYITSIPIGGEVDINSVVNAAIDGSGAPASFKIPPGGLTMCVYGGSLAASDIAIAYNQAATCAAADITLSLTS